MAHYANSQSPMQPQRKLLPLSSAKSPDPRPIVIPVHNALMPLNPDISSLYTVAKILARRTRVSRRSGHEKAMRPGQAFARAGTSRGCAQPITRAEHDRPRPRTAEPAKPTS